ncbi:hypothetical protein A2631_04190 [Candidatus Daviesbacteria bacterium RIFCSPHIGHO2_01_FULL_44_29]|uniref:Oxidized purine nucleoside triphosphate hydrolase n=1 Tax=Candidatus Daviesbacteria bacterium RIFCSPHIGHO2_02_FULL_43_12 TaxID=1797776 RepID=A0A1F5KGV0_9BACT|nr:MAG: hypothetical protein A2631_04190 [Candidatus Daviesbacteria bacterium RIFCSPHIGHO2_01_FULL_44_29]OGE40152.1 MAG: hypothetical protein A3D25_03920 [Candidatus Daviesbacteria bacterium RIFCSPHIGHO2_02_FULL_43_12]OGE40542.1 MAG: hypothetical protein A3E86_00865 [Candidatus Daviesbacteria bacterium RIFCSPHIGHO2_12_FULL_47_45]OGE70465.1 MAG: hypothetical protein A3B55_01650 [Candidatus Daviesbacteria bacterium RIFCSPLOWO2_01_FULL_43_15]
MKKTGFGKGKWNGVGGKVEPGESVEQAAKREALEEIGVTITISDLLKVADIQFLFPQGLDKNNNQQVSVFLVNNWQGEPTESSEMKPKWFKTSEIPYQQMWSDDKLWLPEVLRGRKISAEFTFDKKEEISKFLITDLALKPVTA